MGFLFGNIAIPYITIPAQNLSSICSMIMTVSNHAMKYSIIYEFTRISGEDLINMYILYTIGSRQIYYVPPYGV